VDVCHGAIDRQHRLERLAPKHLALPRGGQPRKVWIIVQLLGTAVTFVAAGVIWLVMRFRTSTI
jgi:hypothetical protein